MLTIRTLVAMCPLIGLLGTVTGMIGVFEVMAQQGTGNPRLMASGISQWQQFRQWRVWLQHYQVCFSVQG